MVAALQSHGLIVTMTEDPPIILQRVVRVLEDNIVRKVMLTVTTLAIGGQIGLFGSLCSKLSFSFLIFVSFLVCVCLCGEQVYRQHSGTGEN